MTRRAVPLVGIVLVTALAACSVASAPSPPPSSPGATVPSLDGHTYLSTAVEGATLVPGTRVRLTFADGGLNASGGCNTMGGRYAIDGGRLTAGQLSITEMACDDARQQQDEWLARLLGGAAIDLQSDVLTLAEGTVRLTLLDEEVATPDQPLEGTSWVLDGIVAGDAVSSVPSGVTAVIQVAGGRVQVNAGCNTGGGTVVVAADAAPPTISFGPIGLTKMACQPEVMAVESAIASVLTGTVGYAIDGDALTLTAGDRGLTFRAATCSHCRP